MSIYILLFDQIMYRLAELHIDDQSVQMIRWSQFEGAAKAPYHLILYKVL